MAEETGVTEPDGIPQYGPKQAAVAALIPQAIADNITYLAIPAPTADDQTAQIRRLTRQLQGFLRQVANDFSDVSEITETRTVVDGVTSAGSTTVTSATANFTSLDLNRPISGDAIPAGAAIASVVDAHTVQISSPAEADGTGITLTIG